MRRLLERWPPAAWLAVYVASLLILIGGRGKWPVLVAGMVLAVGAAAAGAYLALRRRPGRPRPRGFVWTLGGVVLFYVLCAIAAAFVSPLYALAALAAGVIPFTAVALLLAMMRSKTVETERGMRDTSADDHEDPYPGIGLSAPRRDVSRR
ncbi:MAG TPA: hypothetical protein VF257_08580 [Solirubrobacteraceae bacterium]